MKFQPENLKGESVVQAYEAGQVIINGKKYTSSVMFGANCAPTAWSHTEEGLLNEANCGWLFDSKPAGTEVILVGTGAKQVFPSIEVRRFFASRNCPVEFMDTHAACRTYNILVGEGRQVIAAILL